MKAWSVLPNSWSGRLPMRHLLLCVGVLVGAVLMTSYVRLLHQHMAQAGQSRLGQHTPAGELAAVAVAPALSGHVPAHIHDRIHFDKEMK